MGKLEKKSDGYYILELQMGAISLKKAFMDADKPFDKISVDPAPEGFYLEIPDVDADGKI